MDQEWMFSCNHKDTFLFHDTSSKFIVSSRYGCVAVYVPIHVVHYVLFLYRLDRKKFSGILAFSQQHLSKVATT